jgi:hypothetical protein
MGGCNGVKYTPIGSRKMFNIIGKTTTSMLYDLEHGEIFVICTFRKLAVGQPFDTSGLRNITGVHCLE